MSTPSNPRQEHPNTYFVQDRSNEDELARLQIQDQLFTAGMGGVLPEQSDPTPFRRVLDVGCGPGGWLIAAARTYPTMSRLVGVDVRQRMIDYARTQAAAQQVADRVQFDTMDALRMLEFQNASFDLVNQRLGLSYMRTWDWPKLLSEFQRVTRPGGVIRLTEAEMLGEVNSPAIKQLGQLLLQALYNAGHFFTPEKDGLTKELASLLQKSGLQNVQTRVYRLEHRAGTPEGQHFYQDVAHLYRTTLPFLRKWGRVPDNYETLYQQMLSEVQQPGFVASWNMLTAWGTKSQKKVRPKQ
jgi:ubiquinone/menaquinone biosynthesis C-methylase UbiE